MLEPNAQTKPTRSNEAWIKELSSGDSSAISDLTSYICRGLRGALRGKVDENLAEDFAQDSVLKILGALDSYRGDCLFTTWSMSIAMRVAFSELRRARWRDVSLESLMEEKHFTEPPSSGVAPDDLLALEQLVKKLRSAIESTLSERQRMVIKAELCDMPQSVLCERLDTNRNALYKLGHDARLKLKSALLAQGISDSDVRCILAAASN